MDTAIATELHALHYSETMTLAEYQAKLEKGLMLISKNPVTDKLFVSRFYNQEDQVAVNIALQYNEELMVRLLMI